MGSCQNYCIYLHLLVYYMFSPMQWNGITVAIRTSFLSIILEIEIKYSHLEHRKDIKLLKPTYVNS